MRKKTYLEFGNNYELQFRMALIKELGFDGIFIWQDEDSNRTIEVVKAAREHGLDVETMHLRFEGCNHLWLDDEDGRNYVDTVIMGIFQAASLQIPTVIMHTIAKDTHPEVNELGLERIRLILNVCESYHVNLAIENIRELKYIDRVFASLQSPFLKMCFDSGHTNCFAYRLNDVSFDQYAPYLHCVHLHDNLGDYDGHLIPFQGKIDFKWIVHELKRIGFKGPLTSEAHIAPNQVISDRDFLTQVMQALNKLETYFGDVDA